MLKKSAAVSSLCTFLCMFTWIHNYLVYTSECSLFSAFVNEPHVCGLIDCYSAVFR